MKQRGGNCGQDPLLGKEKTRQPGQIYDWLVQIISVGSGAWGYYWLSGTYPGVIRASG